MRDPQMTRRTGPVGPHRSGGNGNGNGHGPTEPLDRSHLLRRESRFPFPGLAPDPETIRLRRERRVSASFRGIPPLARNGRD